jgi:hypothetical protein
MAKATIEDNLKIKTYTMTNRSSRGDAMLKLKLMKGQVTTRGNS